MNTITALPADRSCLLGWDRMQVAAGLVALFFLRLLLPGLCSEAPSLSNEPPSHVAFYNGSGAAVPCEARGGAGLVVRWLAGPSLEIAEDLPGVRYVRPADHALVFPPFSRAQFRQDVHMARYRCQVSTQIGTLISRPVDIRAVLQQAYEARAYDEFVIRGNTGILKCVLPNYILDYVSVTSWIRNDGFVIFPQQDAGPDQKYVLLPSGQLVIRSAGFEESHTTYRCQLRDLLSGHTQQSTSAVRLIVTKPESNVPPTIIQTSRTIKVNKGQSAILPCIAQGFPPPSYRWMRDGLERQGSGALLIVPNVDASDGGLYVCAARNEVGEARAELQLQVVEPLKVTVWPAMQRSNGGGSATFNCTVMSGHPPASSVAWLKDGKPLGADRRVTQTSRTSLHITGLQPEDQGVYQCEVHNSEESALAAGILRVASEPPMLVETSPDGEATIVRPGEPFSLRCLAAGNPIPQVTWYRYGEAVRDGNGVRVGDFVTRDGRRVASYVNVSRTSAADGGVYECRVENAFGSAAWTSMIKVLGPPFISPMVNRTLVAGDKLILHCPFSGHPVLNVRWLKGGKALPLGRRQRVFPNGTLTVESVVSREDEGRYICEVTSPQGGRATRSLFLTILVPPSITPFAFPPKPREGMRTSVTCNVALGDPPISIRWLKDGVPLSAGDTSLAVESVDEYLSTLVFKPLQLSHSGLYTCLASNAAASRNFSVPLRVNAPPSWTLEPSDESSVAGTPVILNCLADGRPEPRVIWKKEMGEGGAEFRTVISGSRIQSLMNGSLVIREVETTDAGRYMCEASNEVGPPISTVVRLEVHGPPQFDTKFSALSVRRGKPLEFVCQVRGDPFIRIEWKKDRQPLSADQLSRPLIKEDKMGSQLIFSQAERHHTGLYTCLASNSYGEAERTFQLTVQDVPDRPEGLEAQSVLGRSVLLSWRPPYLGNLPLTKYLVQYKPESAGWDDDSIHELSSDLPQVRVADLQPTTAYHFRVLAENQLGRSEPSEPLSVTTDGEVPGAPPRNVQVTATGARTILVTWEPPPTALHHGTLRGYYVGYKERGEPGMFSYKSLSNLAGLRAEVTGLRRASPYLVVVQAFNDKGAGPWSDEIAVRTLQFDPPVIQTVSVTATTSASITLSWEAVDTDDSPISGFVVSWREEGDAWTENQLGRDATGHVFSGLRCGTRYQFYVKAFNDAGSGEPSDIVAATTDGLAPVAPKGTDLGFVTRNSTSITLHLSAWRTGGCPITFFAGQFQKDGGSWTPLVPMEGGLTAGDLSPATWYRFSLAARNTVGVTDAEFRLATLTLTGATVAPEVPDRPPNYLQRYQRSLSILVPVLSAVVVLVAVSLAVFLLMCRRRRLTHLYDGSGGGTQTGEDSKDAVSLTEKPGYPPRESLYFPAPYAATRVHRRAEDRGEHLYDIPQPRNTKYLSDTEEFTHLDERDFEYEGTKRQSLPVIDESPPSTYTKILKDKRFSTPGCHKRWRDDGTYSPIHLAAESLEFSDAECDRDLLHLCENDLKRSDMFISEIRQIYVETQS